MTPVVIVVGADKGGVGKTTISRALLDYFEFNNKDPRAFDTESKKEGGVLMRFFPRRTEMVDLSISTGLMRVFDSLRTSPLTIIDIRAGLLLDSLQTLANIGFLEKARSGEIKIATLHVLDGSVAALDEIAEAAKLLSSERYYLVRNHINERSFFDWNEARSKTISGNIIDILKLDERASEAVDDCGMSYETFVKETDSDVLRGYVRYWLGRVYKEFDNKGINSL